MPAPTCRKEFKRFLGMVNYLARFSPRLGNIERHLRELTKKTAKWCWDIPQKMAFEGVKREITGTPVLAKFSLQARYRVTADSSAYALGWP